MTSKSSTRVDDDDFNTYRPKVTSKSVVINRGVVPRSRQSSSYSYSSGGGRQSFGSMFNPQVFTKISSTGIADYRSHRENEKREMQDLNERLAGYIEKVRFLEARIKEYEAQLEALRNRKQEDWKPIRDMYEGELDQCRKVIADLSSQKGVSEARVAGYQDEIQSLKDL
nr:hypothetical protein BaRGS_011497 [Batillaria attramentaria]